MKKIWRILLITIIPILLVGGGAAAYLALTADIDVTTKEALSWVSGNEFQLSLMPGETAEIVLEIHNASTASLPVTLTKTVSPPLAGLTVVCPDSFTAPANDNIKFNIVIIALPNVEVGTTTILIEFDR